MKAFDLHRGHLSKETGGGRWGGELKTEGVIRSHPFRIPSISVAFGDTLASKSHHTLILAIFRVERGFAQRTSALSCPPPVPPHSNSCARCSEREGMGSCSSSQHLGVIRRVHHRDMLARLRDQGDQHAEQYKMSRRRRRRVAPEETILHGEP